MSKRGLRRGLKAVQGLEKDAEEALERAMIARKIRKSVEIGLKERTKSDVTLGKLVPRSE